MLSTIRPHPRVYLERLKGDYSPVIRQGLEYAGFFNEIPAGAKVFLKPNLTYPSYKPGVMTSIECIRGVTEVLVERGYRVVIGEADGGGYNRFSMDEVFEEIGLNGIARDTGAELVNISFMEPEMIAIPIRGRTLRVSFPKRVLHEMDAFITLPVPKIHMNSLVSMSIKNQWGCIQNPSERLKMHPYLAAVMYEFSKRLPRAYSIMDGRYGLNRSGPMRGDVVELDWVLVANDLVAADRVGCRLLQVDERQVGHLQYFQKKGWWGAFEEIRMNQGYESFTREKFYLKREWTDFPGLACFHNSLLAWLGYHSPMAGALHYLLYLFREPFYDHELEKKKLGRKQSPE
jgi:uncharacterized protein (DUF362 family)